MNSQRILGLNSAGKFIILNGSATYTNSRASRNGITLFLLIRRLLRVNRVCKACVFRSSAMLVRQVYQRMSTRRITLLIRALSNQPYLCNVKRLKLYCNIKRTLRPRRQIRNLYALNLRRNTMTSRSVRGSLLLNVLNGMILATRVNRTIRAAQRYRALRILTITNLRISALRGIMSILVKAVNFTLLSSNLRDSFARALSAAGPRTSIALNISERLGMALIRVKAGCISTRNLTLIRRLNGFISTQRITQRINDRMLK